MAAAPITVFSISPLLILDRRLGETNQETRTFVTYHSCTLASPK